MTRRRRRADRETDDRIDDLDEDDADEPDDEPDPAATDQDNTIEDLRSEADAQVFDQTFRLGTEDIPIASGDEPALPRPWQGIPRVAVVYNFNYVYDDDRDEWVRDTGNSGGGTLDEVLSVEATIPSGTAEGFNTGLTDYDLGGDVLLPAVVGGDGGSAVRSSFYNEDTPQAGNDVAFEVFYATGQTPSQYRLAIENNKGSPVGVAGKVFRL